MLALAIYFLVKLGLLQLYPAYICYKALKVNNQQEFGSLLTFWVVSISYLAVEYFSDIFLFWFPFYTEIKLLIVLWLILPQTQGASVFYTTYLDPFLHTHEQQIDNALLEIQAKLKETILLYGKRLIENTKRLILDTIFKGQKVDTTEYTPPPPAAAAATQDPSTMNGIINPYNLFSTFIASTANRFQQQQQEAITVPLPVTPDTDTPLGRAESHDSLHSFVNVKSNAVTTDNPLQQQTSSWGGYLSSFVWKQEPVTVNKKQD